MQGRDFTTQVSAWWKIRISLQVILSQGFSKHSFSCLPLLLVPDKVMSCPWTRVLLTGAKCNGHLGTYATKGQWQSLVPRSCFRFTVAWQCRPQLSPPLPSSQVSHSRYLRAGLWCECPHLRLWGFSEAGATDSASTTVF